MRTIEQVTSLSLITRSIAVMIERHPKMRLEDAADALKHIIWDAAATSLSEGTMDRAARDVVDEVTSAGWLPPFRVD